MNNCAIVCEYNPFHTGHKFQIDQVKPLVDNIVCVMSGQFVQSGLPAFCDKSIRAECAVRGGADAVIELPTVYATASAQFFAEGALKIISAIKDVKYIAMGATAVRDELYYLADIKLKHTEKFNNALKTELKNGKSYNAATVAALTSLCDEKHSSLPQTVLSDPNNILCLEYISAISKFAPNIQPIVVRRMGAGYNDLMLDSEFVSASAIRECAKTDFKKASKFIPFLANEIETELKTHCPDHYAYKKIAVLAVKNASENDISTLRDCSEGMEFLIKNMSKKSNFDDYINDATCRRYGKKRLQRLMLDVVLGIDRTLLEKRFCTRLLACRSEFDYSILPDFVKTNNRDIKAAAAADTEILSVLKIDEKATALYNTLCSIDGDYYNYSLVKI